MIFRILFSKGTRRLKFMPLIEEILKYAEKDLDITEILTFIVTANPQLQSEIQLPQDLNNETDIAADKDEVVKFIIKLYNIWISALSGQLCFNVDTSNMGSNTQLKISEFTKEHQFPSMIKPEFPEDFTKELFSRIRKARQSVIQPLANKPINNHLYNGIERVVTNQTNFAGVNFFVKNDSVRIVKVDYLKTFENFKIALQKISKALNDFLRSSNEENNESLQQPASHSAPSTSIFNCCGNRKENHAYAPLKANTSINSDRTVDFEEKKPDFLQALLTYRTKRMNEQDRYHFWGQIFSCIASPFSLKEKINAVDKLIYWIHRERGNLAKNEQQDLQLQFTERDIGAIRDHRLGIISSNYENDLPQAFKNAEQTFRHNQSEKNRSRAINTYSRKL